MGNLDSVSAHLQSNGDEYMLYGDVAQNVSL